MIDFIKWWYSNSDGNEYMTLLGCALNDVPIVIITLILCGGIVATYLQIAFESYKQGKEYPNSITKRYLLDKTFVFVFCALSGYGYTILSAFVNPYKFRIIMLAILLFASVRLLKSLKNKNVIERIYEGEQLIEQKLLHYKLTKERWGSDDDNANNLIKYKDQLNIEFNKWIEATEGVKYMRVYHPDYECYFITEMNPQETKNGIASFALHWHDSFEYCHIKEGHLVEMTQNLKEYKKGETVVYEPFNKHKPVSTKFSIFEVGFKENV